MKKLFYVALMALTLGFFAGCTGVSVGNEPKLDEEKSTLNGKIYDNTTYKCWEFTWEYTEKTTGEPDEHESGVDYEWLTELMAQYEKAVWEWSHNVSASAYGVTSSIKGTCTLRETPKDENHCYADED